MYCTATRLPASLVFCVDWCRVVTYCITTQQRLDNRTQPRSGNSNNNTTWRDIAKYSMGTTCSQPLATTYKEPEPRPLDPMGQTRIRLTKEIYPALCDEDFRWMNSTKGSLVITGEDQKDLESPNAKVRRFKTEEAVQKFIEGRLLVNTTVIRWYNIYAVPQYDMLSAGYVVRTTQKEITVASCQPQPHS